jgi:hypothetical protein
VIADPILGFWKAIFRYGGESQVPTFNDQSFFCGQHYCYTFTNFVWVATPIDPTATGLPTPEPVTGLTGASIPHVGGPYCDGLYCYLTNHFGVYYARPQPAAAAPPSTLEQATGCCAAQAPYFTCFYDSGSNACVCGFSGRSYSCQVAGP